MNNTNLKQNKDYKAYENFYSTDEIEILVLFSDESGAGAKFLDSRDLSAYFLAYINLQTNELQEGCGRINWLLSDELNDRKGLYYPYYFQNEEICRLKVRELKDTAVPEVMLESAYNKFMVVQVIEREVLDKRLENILHEYRKPIIISDDILRYIHKEQATKDEEFRTFATKELTELANDWLENTNKKITSEGFAKRISLNSFSIDFNGNVLAYDDDDDMLYSHIIEVRMYKNKLESAEIGG